MKIKITSFVILTTVFSFTSCATIFTGTTDKIEFKSTPAGALVYDRGIEKCTTPCSIAINRSLSEKSITIKKDGYQDKTIELDRKFNAISILNFFGLIGWGVDAATDSLMKYDTKGYDIKLESNK